MNYNVTKEVKQVIYAPGTVKKLSIAVAVNKILTDAEKDEIKSLEEKYIQKWCEYYVFEQRQDKERRIKNAIMMLSEKTAHGD